MMATSTHLFNIGCALKRELRKKGMATTKFRCALAAAAVSFLGALACAQAQTPVKGGTLTVGLETDVRGFDTVTGGVYGISGRTVAGAIQEPLIYGTTEREYKAQLATSWEPNASRTEWTVKLREGVTFHDGKPFTADAVAKHFNRILDPKNKARARGFITAVKGAKAVDATTVKFTLKHPWEGFVPMLADRDMAGLMESPDQSAAGKQNRHPIGTGPYVFDEWRGGDRIIVKRNPNYWDKDNAHLDEIVYRILPDPQTRFQSLRAGDVDVIWTDRASSIHQAEKDKSVVLYKQAGAGSGLFLLNASAPPLDDARVRAGVLHAMSQEVVNKVLWKGTRPFAEHPLPHKCAMTNYRGHDTEKAKALFAAYGKPVKLKMIHTTTPRGRELGEIYQQMLKKAGAQLELIPVDQNILVKRVFTNKYMMSGWRVADANNIGPQLFGLSFSKSPYNITRYKSPELDKLAMAMRTATSPENRSVRECNVIAHINDAANMRFAPGNRYHIVMRKNVKGVIPFTFGSAYVWKMWKEKG
jgi:ABC-type transport system substrate-binding protein